jgi:hypothetical protein
LAPAYVDLRRQLPALPGLLPRQAAKEQHLNGLGPGQIMSGRPFIDDG